MESNRREIVPDCQTEVAFENSTHREDHPTDSFEVVLGGGGIKGFGHIGLLKAIEEREIGVENFTGISIGSLIATLHVNGFKPEEINEILCEELNLVMKNADLEALNWDVRKWVTVSSALLSPYLTLWNFEKTLRALTLKYKLEPKANLKIVASNLFSGGPVIFEGEDYDLPAALAASCAFPMVMKPVILDKSAPQLPNPAEKILDWPGDFRGRFSKILEKPSELHDKFTRILLSRSVLIDGGIHHPHPGHFCKRQAIIGKLGFARQLPNEPLSPAEYMCHVLELIGSSVLDNVYRDPSEHIVVPVGMPDVGILSFALPLAKCQSMVAYGYDQAQRFLPAATQGKSVA